VCLLVRRISNLSTAPHFGIEKERQSESGKKGKPREEANLECEIILTSQYRSGMMNLDCLYNDMRMPLCYQWSSPDSLSLEWDATSHSGLEHFAIYGA
jgi:hypothetical protein